MANEAGNVRVAITGAVYVAPTATAAPIDADGALDVAFVELGYVDPDGINTSNDKSTSQIRAWQNSALIRETVTEATTTYTFMLMEAKTDVLETYYGAPIDTDINGDSIAVNAANTGGRKSWVLDMIDGDDIQRHYIPEGEVTSVEAISFVNGEAVKYGITVTAYVVDDRAATIFYSALA